MGIFNNNSTFNDNRIISNGNSAAFNKYKKRGGKLLLGKSLLDCHNSQSIELINKIIGWFQSNQSNNRIYMYHDDKENKDVYMIALRNEEGNLIGYYEKHEYRNPETQSPYQFD